MATNYATYKGLKKLARLIDSELNARPEPGVVDEIKAWNRLLTKHLGEHKKQLNQTGSLRYEYHEQKILLLKGDKVKATLRPLKRRTPPTRTA
jgi:hypothetical protein